MWKVNIVNETDGMFLYETFKNTEREIPEAICSFFANQKLDLEGVTKMRIEKIYIDREKVFRDALEEIARQPYYEEEGNSFEIQVAREALGWSPYIPEYDEPHWKKGEEK